MQLKNKSSLNIIIDLLPRSPLPLYPALPIIPLSYKLKVQDSSISDDDGNDWVVGSGACCCCGRIFFPSNTIRSHSSTFSPLSMAHCFNISRCFIFCISRLRTRCPSPSPLVLTCLLWSKYSSNPPILSMVRSALVVIWKGIISSSISE